MYDTNNRLTFAQDGNQRTQGTPKWSYYLYDNLSRLTEQGECTNTSTLAGKTPLVKNYYDTYAGFRTATGNNANYPDDTSGNARSRQTGSIVTVPGSSTSIRTAYYYDIKGRVTKTVANNLLGGYDITTTTYTFTNQPATVTRTHTATGKSTRTEVYTYTYDHADRISKVEHTLDGTKVTLAGYTYDTVGRLSTKSLHGSASNKLTYGYNVRGWLTDISSTKFTQSLTYGNGTAGYNGNITATVWTANGSSHSYAFAYDGLNRLTSATHGAGRFTEKVTSYDKNGNILALQRYGQTAASTYGLIDNLTLTYDGNRLTRADDAVAASAYGGGFEFKDAVKQANEYTYDANGNLTKDLNKNISSIQYNCLNLPSVVTFSDGSTITYTYAADGTKLRTVHKIGGTTTTTDYCGDVVYENGVQKLLLTEEGYVTLADKKYHYYLQDHQGNNRVVLNQSGTVEEVNHYYPFGGVYASTGNVQPYKYNGKELDAKKGLNWYDYGARHYDAALGRFLTVDPSAESYFDASPYGYCGNNPVNRIDPTGADWYRHKDEENRWVYQWSTDVHTQEDVAQIDADAQYLGLVHYEERTYYSLFGSIVDAKSKEGKATQKFDDAIIAYADYLRERVYDNEATQRKTDFDIGVYTQPSALGLIENTYFKFEYGVPGAKGSAYYHILGKGVPNKGTFESWTVANDYRSNGNRGSGAIKDGYNLRFVRSGGSDSNWSGRIVFTTKEQSEKLYNAYRKLFNYGKK